MQITYSGSQFADNFFLSNAFFTPSDILIDLAPVSSSSTEVVFDNSLTGLRTTIEGTGLVLAPTGTGGFQLPVAGTITSISMVRGTSASDPVIGSVANISWDFADFWSALQVLSDSGDLTDLAALYNSSGPITVDGSGAASGFGMYDFFDFSPPGQNLNEFITQPITVIGSNASDDLMGALGDDSITPGTNARSDAIVYTPGNDTIDFGAADADSYYVLRYSLAPGYTATIDSPNNAGSIASGGFTQTLANVNAAFTNKNTADGLSFIGSDQADTFNITLDSSQGSQWISILGNEGNDTINITFDGDGVVRYSFRSGSQGADANLATGVVQDEEGFTDTLNVSGTGGTLELFGSDFADRFTGSTRDEVFIAAQGDDTIDGGGGNDTVFGDDGDDLVDGGAGNDLLRDDVGNDTLNGGEGNDSMNGGLYADVLNGDAGNDDIRGNRGNDTIDGGDGNDIARGGAKNDFMLGGDGEDTLYGQKEQDTLHGGADNDTLGGGDGDDLLFGDAGNDLLNGNSGTDTLDGGANNDTIEGKSGDDEIRGGSGNDRAKGGADNDTLDGEGGNDLLFGNLGNDQISGGTGMDTLIGGDGNDRLTGDAGADELRGGTGTDVFVFDSGHGEDTIGDLDVGVDEIEISNALAAGRSEAQIVALGNVVNGDYRIDLGGGDVLVLEDITSDAGLADMFSIV